MTKGKKRRKAKEGEAYWDSEGKRTVAQLSKSCWRGPKRNGVISKTFYEKRKIILKLKG